MEHEIREFKTYEETLRGFETKSLIKSLQGWKYEKYLFMHKIVK
jgi:hypothetical protein